MFARRPSTEPLDQQCRAMAAWLGREFPAWVIWWGPATRRYWALPRRGVVAPLLEAADPEALVAALREAQAWNGIGPTARRP